MIELKPITWQNLEAVLNLEIPEAQMRYVKSIPTFIAQSYVNLTLGYEDRSLAVYDNDALIGYVKLVYVPADEAVYEMEEASIMIDALILDKAFQGKGYGKSILDAILNGFDTVLDVSSKAVSLVIHDDNRRAIHLARGYGFVFYKKRRNETAMSIYLMRLT